MNVVFGFDVGRSYRARQLDLEADGDALSALGQRCAAYLRSVAGKDLRAGDVPRVFLNMLRPRSVPAERSFVLGIFPRADGRSNPVRLVGVLRFLHPDSDPGTWYIPLLLLEPAVRGQGLGSALHSAFASWSAARGARRLVVAVSEANGQALHFWRDHLRYTEAASNQRHPGGEEPRRSRDLECRLASVRTVTPWERLRV